MEFDKSRVYTLLNADELKVGSKVIVADNLKCLKDRVEHGLEINELMGVGEENCIYRFSTGYGVFAIAYLVEEPQKLKWTDLNVGHIITNGDKTAMITCVDSTSDKFHVCTGYKWIDDVELEEWWKVEK
jgi:hypothetical protein